MKIEHLVAFGMAGQPVTCPAYNNIDFPSQHHVALFLLSRFNHFAFIDSFSVFTDNNRYMSISRQGYTIVYNHDWDSYDKQFANSKNNYSI